MLHAIVNRIALAVLLLLLTLLPATTAQTPGVLHEYGGAPQAWRPADVPEAGVNAKGDLNLDLPILTVPGRGGLDYDVRFRYTSGVRVGQPSSWVGGGWFFDPGSIVRDVHGIAYVSLDDGVTNVDFTDRPRYQPDHYQVTLPGASSPMVRETAGGGTFLPPRRNASGFALTSYRAWKVEASASGPVSVGGETTAVDLDDKTDYNRFVITDESGTRYVFARPTLSVYRGSANSETARDETYVAQWRLVAMLGTDYAGTSLVPNGQESGSWVRLDYGAVTTRRGNSAQACGPDTPSGDLLLQTQYLTKILTPTHEARFTTGGRSQESFPKWQLGAHRALTAIELYARTPSDGVRLLRKAHLDQSAAFESVDECNNTPRLALDAVRYTGSDGSAEPGFAFEYLTRDAADPDGGLLTDDNVDHFGFYESTESPQGPFFGQFDANLQDGAAWSLTSVTYPTGGSETVAYEVDDIANTTDNRSVGFSQYNLLNPDSDPVLNYTVGAGRYRQGGARVTHITRSDGLSEPSRTVYTYGSGQLSGVPAAQWKLTYGGNGGPRITSPVERGRVAVFYDSVTRTNPDGSRVRTHYTTPATKPKNVDRIPAVTWISANAMVAIQGNQDWNWGRPFKTEHVEAGTDRVARTVERDYALSSAVASLAWRTRYYVPVVWGFADRVGRETVTDHYNPDVSTVTDYAYFDEGTRGNSLLRHADVVHEDGRRRRTRYTYAHEVYDGAHGLPDFDDDLHRIGERVREDRIEVSPGGTTTTHAATVTTFDAFTVSGGNGGERRADREVVEPHRTFVWSADAPSTAEPAFQAWGAQDPTPAQWDLTNTVAAYHHTGSASEIVDARGTTTTLTHDDLGRLTGVSAPGADGAALARAFAYDDRGRLTAVTDENDQTTSYAYDGLGRLTSVRDPDGDPVLSAAYNTSAVPHRVTTTRHGHPNPNTTSVTFFDGLGRPVQTQDKISGSTWSVSATVYDPGDAASPASERAYRPYARSTSGAFQSAAAVESGALAEYGSGTQPYTLTEFTRDATGRPSRVLGPQRPSKGAIRTPGAPPGARRYGVASVDGRAYRYADATDEDGRTTRVYTDAWGHAFRSVEALGTSLAATTHTVFDVAGLPTEVRPPNYFDPPTGSPSSFATRSTYDTRGRMTAHTTPDAGTTRYAYDRAGDLRFSQDATQAPAGRVSFTAYDALGRPTLAGEHPASFDGLDPDQTASWEAHTNAHTVHAYDAKPSAASGSAFAPFSVALNYFPMGNTRGRLVATRTRAHDGTRQMELSGYTDQGFLNRRVTSTTRSGDSGQTAAAYAADLYYGRDRQGRLTTRISLLGTGSGRPEYRHWYAYDGRGLNTHVWSGRTASKPSRPDFRFTYNADGSVASRQMRSWTRVPYTYDVAGRLTTIGGTAWQTSNAVRRPFIASYNYSPGGLVTQARFGHNTRGVGTNGRVDYLRYTYAYDARGRLRTADYSDGGTTGAWAASDAYDVSGISYDPNGNLLSLRRNGADGSRLDDLSYAYEPGTNRIGYLTDAAPASAVTWDAETGNFTHDARGNATSLPAPYDANVSYDHRNRPVYLTTETGNQIGSGAFRYSASGQQYYRHTTVAGTPGPTPGGTTIGRVSGRSLPAQPAPSVLGAPLPDAPAPQDGRTVQPAEPTRGEREGRETASPLPTGEGQSEGSGAAIGEGAQSPSLGGPLRPDTTDTPSARPGDAQTGRAPSDSARTPRRLGRPTGQAVPVPGTVQSARTDTLSGRTAQRSAEPAAPRQPQRSPWAARPDTLDAPGTAQLGRARPDARPAPAPLARPAPRTDSTTSARRPQGEAAPVAGRTAQPSPASGAADATAATSGSAVQTFEFLFLDATLAGGLQPVLGTATTDDAADETAAYQEVAFSILSPTGEVLGRTLPDRSEARRYYARDLLGSVRAVINESGGLAEQAAYGPWGVRLAGRLPDGADGAPGSGLTAGSAREGFTGKPRLSALGGGAIGGLNDFGARVYAPAFGRFLQTDPVAQFPSPYLYAGNSPTNLIDPDGSVAMPPDDYYVSRGSITVVRTGQPDRFFVDDPSRGNNARWLQADNASDVALLGQYLRANDALFADVMAPRAGATAAGQKLAFDARVAAGTSNSFEGMVVAASVFIEPVDWLLMGRDALRGDLDVVAAVAAIGPGSYGVLRMADLPSDARRHLTTNVERAFGKLWLNHGIDRTLASQRLHDAKKAFNVPADADVYFGPTGDMWHPVTGEHMGSLTTGGSRR